MKWLENELDRLENENEQQKRIINDLREELESYSEKYVDLLEENEQLIEQLEE